MKQQYKLDDKEEPSNQQEFPHKCLQWVSIS